MSKKFDSDGFRVGEDHAEIDWSFLKGGFGGKLENIHEDHSFEISPDFYKAQKRNDIDDFESLVDSAQG